MNAVLLALFLLIACVASADDQAVPTLSVPAEYVRQIVPPGSTNQFLRPSAIHIDRNFDEILVADPGNNRVVIFDRHGTYRYEFSGAEHLSTPQDIDVDSAGYIYVLGTTTRGRRVLRFDYDGLYLGDVDLPDQIDGTPMDPRSLAIDAENNLYILDHAGVRVAVFNGNGVLLRSFALLPEMDIEGLRAVVLGAHHLRGHEIFVPISSMGTVLVFDLEGQYLRSVGHAGNNIGELNFPVAVATTDDDLLMVLDKHRFNVSCYSPGGRFLGEFGGKGIRAGWFYHPSLLAVDEDAQVYVGQLFQNKVQVCRIPEFIMNGHLQGSLPVNPEDDSGRDAAASSASQNTQPGGGEENVEKSRHVAATHDHDEMKALSVHLAPKPGGTSR